MNWKEYCKERQAYHQKRMLDRQILGDSPLSVLDTMLFQGESLHRAAWLVQAWEFASTRSIEDALKHARQSLMILIEKRTGAATSFAHALQDIAIQAQKDHIQSIECFQRGNPS